jgi:hypothetical protein
MTMDAIRLIAPGANGIGGSRDQQRIAAHWTNRSDCAVGTDYYFQNDIPATVSGESFGGILRLGALAETALPQFGSEPRAVRVTRQSVCACLRGGPGCLGGRRFDSEDYLSFFINNESACVGVSYR